MPWLPARSNRCFGAAQAASEIKQTSATKRVRTIGIDAINLDETPDDDHPGEGFPVHHLVARAGGVIGENFRNLDQVDWADPFVMCLPVRLTGADGAPVRAVAVRLS